MENLIEAIEQAPEGFTIGKDAYGWWYSLSSGATRSTGFETFEEAVMDYLANR